MNQDVFKWDLQTQIMYWNSKFSWEIGLKRMSRSVLQITYVSGVTLTASVMSYDLNI